MKRFTAYRPIFVIMMLALLLIAVVPALADDPTNLPDGYHDQGVVHDDGRLNQIHHMGGAMIHCVDATGHPTMDYHEGGLRVSDDHGQEMLFIPAATIDEIGPNPAQNTLLGQTERMWYGNVPIAVYRLTSGELQMNGMDEHGKLVEFIFHDDCVRVGAATDEIDGASQNEFGNVFH
jgi:hypothetical protein